MVKVMIATPLSKELVQEVGDVNLEVDVLYEASLLPPPRHPSDHKGEPDFRRDEEGEQRWERMLSEVMDPSQRAD